MTNNLEWLSKILTTWSRAWLLCDSQASSESSWTHLFVGTLIGYLHIFYSGGAANPDALGDAGASTAARSCRRTLGRSVHTTQHLHLQTSQFVARQDHKSFTSATCQNTWNHSARGRYKFFVFSRYCVFFYWFSELSFRPCCWLGASSVIIKFGLDYNSRHI